MKKIIFILFSFLISNIIFSQTLPPLPATSGSSSAGSTDQECFKRPPILDNKKVFIEIENNHFYSPIAIVNLDIEVENLQSNTITSIQFDNNGSMNGYPQWNYGKHTIQIYFSDKVRSSLPDGTFNVTAKINYMISDRNGNKVYIYEKGVCIKDPTIMPNNPDGEGETAGGGRKYAQQDNLFEIELPKTKQQLDAYILDSFDPTLFINVEDAEVPVSVYVIGLSNPNYINTIQQDQYLPFGKNTIRLEELPSGIYQVVVQQGAKISRLKFVSVD